MARAASAPPSGFVLPAATPAATMASVGSVSMTTKPNSFNAETTLSAIPKGEDEPDPSVAESMSFFISKSTFTLLERRTRTTGVQAKGWRIPESHTPRPAENTPHRGPMAPRVFKSPMSGSAA
ncbi:hypothetical protein N825_30585 [Skermanella stibiiresistens SB22]|uniref:Uncharacterized protein n=2 Tax=Skermanella TaxID=204447 RepID=W9H4S3_9PROT|nr:hypothetical protein N825_30585 [Skermanella stibiiresistens SB22]